MPMIVASLGRRYTEVLLRSCFLSGHRYQFYLKTTNLLHTILRSLDYLGQIHCLTTIYALFDGVVLANSPVTHFDYLLV